MPKFNKLSAKKVSAIRKPGRHGDGLGLYLQVTGDGIKSWLFRYMLNGRSRGMGLGPIHTVSLGRARELAREAREALMAGMDPLEERARRVGAVQAREAKRMTFAECAHAYLSEHLSTFRNPKHRQQWQTSLDTASASFGRVNIAEIDTAMIIKLLTPIWAATPETGSRVRGRVEKVLSWATARALREGENPARWKDHLEHLLKAKGKEKAHHSAMPYLDVPAFMVLLRDRDSISARALEFTILTAARTSEVLEARWEEVDLDAKVWTCPAERTKSGRVHRVPLSDRAVEILRGLVPHVGRFIFPGQKEGKPLSNMSMLQFLRGSAGNGFTVHGFRSAFSDWARDRTAFHRDIVEMSLAHAIKDKTEAAYRRGDALDKRRTLMDAWTRFCMEPTVVTDNVVALNRAG